MLQILIFVGMRPDPLSEKRSCEDPEENGADHRSGLIDGSAIPPASTAQKRTADDYCSMNILIQFNLLYMLEW